MRYLVLSALLLALATGGMALYYHLRVARDPDAAPEEVAGAPLVVPLPQITARTPEPMRVIYLNREGALLHPSPKNDSMTNRSTIAQNLGGQPIAIPAFAGTQQQWNAMVECVRDRFAPYDVRVVDQRPVERGYVMAVVGGRPSDLPATDEHGHTHRVTGLAPYNGQPIEDAIVLVFSRELRERPRDVCETAAMEIAHAYGLDHSRHCAEVMTYMRPCGERRFLDRDLPCGEHEDRACGDGAPTQNSHRRLLSVLGPAPSAPHAQR